MRVRGEHTGAASCLSLRAVSDEPAPRLPGWPREGAQIPGNPAHAQLPAKCDCSGPTPWWAAWPGLCESRLRLQAARLRTAQGPACSCVCSRGGAPPRPWVAELQRTVFSSSGRLLTAELGGNVTAFADITETSQSPGKSKSPLETLGGKGDPASSLHGQHGRGQA